MISRASTVMFIRVTTSDVQGDNESSHTSIFELNRSLTLISNVIAEHMGKTIKTVGNLLLVVFDSANDAAFCGLNIIEKSKERFIGVAVALHTGEVSFVGGDIFGDTVNICSRILSACDVGEILISESFRDFLNSREVTLSELGRFEFKGVFYPIEIFRLEYEVSNRSSKPVIYRKAETFRRILAGGADFLLGALVMVLVTVALNARSIYGTLAYSERIHLEDFDLSGGRVESVPRALSDDLFPWIEGEVVEFLPGSSASATFEGSSGNYDIVYGLRVKREAERFGDMIFRYGKSEIPIYPTSMSGRPLVLSLLKSVDLKNGMDLEFRRLNQHPERNRFYIDFIETIPSEVQAFRPRGIEHCYRFYYLWKAIGYDDMNVHFFLIPIPIFIFLQMVISLQVFNTTLGGLLVGIRVRDRATKRKPKLWQVLVRSVSWFLFPLMAWTTLGEDFSWCDDFSHTEVVRKIYVVK